MSYSKILTGAAIIAALSVAAYLLCYRWTTERVPTKPAPKEKGQTWKVIKILLHSQPYMAVCLVGMLFLAAQMFSQSYNTYLFNYYFNAPSLSMMPTVCQYLPVAVIMLFAGKLGARFGRREVCLLSGIGNAFIFLLVWAIATDAIDYNEVSYGLHDEATSYAFFTFMRKLGQTIAAILVNMALLRIGYTDNVLNTANITGGTLDMMFTDSVLIPAVLYFLIFVILRFMYPLGREKIAQLQKEKEKLLSKLAEE